ncbi:non-hydrolyzing UDP-N-acetylglucosamine 2-epimerase [Lacibacterium aquatile]|uniref:UDP-N-acetylglucosamine 2-epimerase (non-hydrolyzing) n=1 Tax=Lacibacterium aquatile TaxID=1168082 RepID=A0ABW5DXL9_9PROT
MPGRRNKRVRSAKSLESQNLILTEKFLIVIGTRPEAIKLAPVVRALMRVPAFKVQVCLTGQHRQLLSQALSAFDIPVDWDLDLMAENQSLASLTSRILADLGSLLAREAPSLVIVQGDTTTAMAAALTAFQMRIPVAHVEAGLRSGDINQPWPEEMNRRLVAKIAAYHFAPTPRSRHNLEAEGIDPAAIVETGNTVIDALNDALDRVRETPELISPVNDLLAEVEGRKLVLATVHRRENLDRRLEEIGAALVRLAERQDTLVVFPAHPNPQVMQLADRLRNNFSPVRVIKPLDYFPFIALMQRADLILTDSGGIQEEAAALGRPILVLRERTERPEVLDGGNGRLVGTDGDAIFEAANNLLDDHAARSAMARKHASFGDGKAAERIVNSLISTLLPSTSPVVPSP